MLFDNKKANLYRRLYFLLSMETQTNGNMRVVNLVVTSDLDHTLNLEKIASTLSNTEYNPEQFPGLIMRVRDPKTAVLLFTSGKIVCTGAKGLLKAEESVQKVIKTLKKINIHIKIKPFLTVQNMVGSGDLNQALDLNYLTMSLMNTEYEPEQFPGLVYKIKKPVPASFLLFTNGKFVCTGVKSEQEMKISLKQLKINLKKVMEKKKKKKINS